MMKGFRWWCWVMLGILVILTLAAGVGGAQYPWEKEESETAPPAAAEPVAPKKASRIDMGPFSFEPTGKMVRYHHEDFGEIFAILDDNEEAITGIYFDTKFVDTSGSGWREAYEETARKSITHQGEGRIEVAGSRALFLTADVEDGMVFYIFPYDEKFTYKLLVFFEDRKEQLSAEVRELLETLKLDPESVGD